ncbi:MAG TPA: hypothetical protein ENG70_02765 [Candidatus Cloacimonetes bacterium]|nr:hypothetical protein [Candidatus Cloacimonadota bacterium]HEX37766.1 hypothetical protein [Candidatus Cloacimonadota bacterium]
MYIYFYALEDTIVVLGRLNMLEIEQLRKELVSTTSLLNSLNRELQNNILGSKCGYHRRDTVERTF